ncbi:precorrin-3B C(17)-methyltransferase [Desulfovermiculus halophilus]|uniref:precorrin-3B C(17)-methyltransferase n=1 Tax=Desulfovermiculus halophilus TaxID=339722 RepID=UPI000B0F4B07|nr:precorrin-3B C(17)-methyltransferase [Desulfovermiculus halophilus]
MAPRARLVLDRAEVIVGYSSYIQLLDQGLVHGKEVISTGMTKEVQRCRAALDLACQGRRTAVVCSGDSGIYALAGLILELMEERNLAESMDLQIVPGIPALAAAASSLGAPLMHDFASISLSDLLTPWEVIDKRVRAAAEADFVIILYNPRSKTRTWQLEAIRCLLLKVRNGDTPVGVVKNASKDDERVVFTTLEGLDTESVDMKCTVIIGNSQTRRIGHWLLTPRGYAAKYDLTKQSGG